MKKKIKSIALVLVGAVCLVGAGYAAWGTQITANTALNSGEWKIILDNDVIPHSLNASDGVGYYKGTDMNSVKADGINPNPLFNSTYGTVDPTSISGGKAGTGDNYVYTIKPEITGDTVDFSFFNLHPGTMANTNYEIRNMGSIPAKIGDVKVILNDGATIEAGSALAELRDAIVVNGVITKHLYSSPSGSDSDPGTTNGIVALPADTTLANLETALEDILKKDSYKLDPKTSSDMNYLDSDEAELTDLEFSIPMGALSGNKGMDQKLKVTVKYDFVQYNEIVQQ